LQQGGLSGQALRIELAMVEKIELAMVEKCDEVEPTAIKNSGQWLPMPRVVSRAPQSDLGQSGYQPKSAVEPQPVIRNL
jgi:hypothetical protein